jgi:cell volume regulation protein A
MIQPQNILIFFSSIIILSYFSSLIYKQTKIPDIIWLLGFGVLLGPVLGVLSKDIFVVVAPLMGVISINIITLDAGIDTDIEIFREVLSGSISIALGTFIGIVLGTGVLTRLFIPETTLLKGMLLGTMLAGISTVAIIGIMDELGQVFEGLERVRALLTIESTIIDPIRIAIAITLIRMLMQPEVDVLGSIRDIYATFTIASILGIILGLGWALILHRLARQRFNYMLTLAILFPLYYLAENFAGQGGGTMAAFTFGLVLANHHFFTERLGFRLRVDVSRLDEFNSEISFVLKSYYFVYIGLIVTLSQQFLIAGLVLTVLCILTRYLVGTAVGNILDFSPEELIVSRLSFPLGTSALVFSQLPLIYDPQQRAIQNPNLYPNLVFPVVLGTVLFTSVIAPFLMRMQLERADSEKDENGEEE